MREKNQFAGALGLCLLLVGNVGAAVQWDNGGADSAWTTVDNWNTNYLPGATAVDRAILAANDSVTIPSDATYTSNAVKLEMRAGAQLSIDADVSVFRSMTMGTTTSKGVAVTHTDGAVTVGTDFSLGEFGNTPSTYTISGAAALDVGGAMTVFPNGRLTVAGDGASVSGGSLTVSGPLDVVLGASGLNAIDVNGAFTIDPASARLTIDASAYTAGAGTIELVQFNSRSGVFDARNISTTGFGSGVTLSIDYDNNSMNLTVTALTDYSEHATASTYGSEYPVQGSNTNFPDFSWDRVPRWIAVRKSTAYTDEDITSIATNFQLVMLEKGNKAGFATNEEGITDAATRLKAINPSIVALFYWNSVMHYNGYDANASYNLDEWRAYETDGEGNRVPVLIRGWPTYDHSIPEMREWWVNTAVGMASRSVIDGVFIDKVQVAPIPAYVNGEPASDHFRMMDELAQGLPAGKLFTGNILRNERDGGNRGHMELQDGSYLERWHMPFKNISPSQSEGDARVVSIQLMREALWKGKIISLSSSPGVENATEAQVAENVAFPLAVFLVSAETNAYFGYKATPDARQEFWEWNTSALPEFNRPLGAPLDPPLKVGYEYTRSYEHVDVWVNVETEEASLVWAVDADQDELPDEWELVHFGSVFTQKGGDNPDNDRYINKEEYIAGLNPNVFDTFAVSNFTVGASNTFEWNTASGHVYNVYWSSNLVDGFSLIKSNAPGGAFSDAGHAGEPAGFYKITVELEQ